MKTLEEEVLFLHFLGLGIVLMLAIFIVTLVVAYNRKREAILRKKRLQEIEYQNALYKEQLKQHDILQHERERIALDMHDELGAGISAIRLHAELIRKKLQARISVDKDLQDLIDASQSMNQTMREMLWNLSQPGNGIGEYTQMIKQHCIHFFSKTDITPKIDIVLDDLHKIVSPYTARHLFLCVKEAINNVAKHSGSSQVHIGMLQTKETLEVNVRDNGIGMPAKVRSGYGLQNMQSRMHEVEGYFDIRSDDQGVSVLFRVTL